MVLQASDYNLKNLYAGTWDPTNPKNFLAKAVGTVFAVAVAVWLFQFARGNVTPMFDSLVSKASGGRVSQAGGVEVF